MTTKRGLRVVLATLALPLFWAGCFASPDYTRITCETNKQCATGYQCNLTTKKCIHAVDASSLGEAGGSHVDGAFDVGSVADLSVPVDAGPADRVSGDAIAAVDSMPGTDTGALADSQISNDIAPPLPDAPAGLDVAGPDVAKPAPDLLNDLPNDLPDDLPIGNKDVPGAVDAGIDSASVADTRPAGSPLGATCATSSDCALGNCVDRVCCDSPCTGACQSCALATSLGKCSNVTGAPAQGHPPCAGSGICAGTCSGQGASCAYHGAETNCGAAGCTNGIATDARTCDGAGSCSSIQTHPCGAFICGASACLTSCTDNSQCVSGDACVSGQCTACSTGQTVCPNLCVNLQTNSSNCGACGHDCLGGACLQEQCQPAVVAGNLDATATVLGVDSQTLYFATYDSPPNSTAFSVSKTALNGTASSISGLTNGFAGVIGNKLFYYGFQGSEGSCTIGACSTTENPLPSPQRIVSFKSPSPQYYSEYDLSSTTTFSISWYATDNTPNATYSQPTDGITSYPSFFSNGDNVYWISYFTDTGGIFHSLGVYTASRTNAAQAQLAGSLTQNMSLVDANQYSLLISDTDAGTLSRVPLPLGLGTSPPQLIVTLPLAASLTAATEDAGGIYWMDGAGTLSRCTASNCSGTKKVLAIGQSQSSSLYQDTGALYWGRGGPNQVMRLAK